MDLQWVKLRATGYHRSPKPIPHIYIETPFSLKNKPDYINTEAQLPANFLRHNMVLLRTPQHSSSSSKLTSSSLFISMSAFMALCAKKAGRLTRKLKPNPMSDRKLDLKSSPLITRPKQLITTLSNKAISFVHRKKLDEEGSDVVEPELKDWGDGGVWQRSILMGDKCEPLDFSGVIYYDIDGKQLNEVPIRSPRASPLPGYLTRAGKSELWVSHPPGIWGRSPAGCHRRKRHVANVNVTYCVFFYGFTSVL